MKNNCFIDINLFECLCIIGEGSFCVAYKAKEKSTGNVFAIKILLQSINDGSNNEVIYRNIAREVNIISKLDHPSIPRWKGFSPTNWKGENKPSIIMEYIAGGSLRKFIDLERNSRSEWNDTTKLNIIYGIASGMAYLHSHDIIHRDLKPENIHLNEKKHPKIIDFNLSKFDQQNQFGFLNSAKGIKGTIPYLPKEAISDYNYTKAVDVYSFAVIVFEMITTESPLEFKNRNMFKISEPYKSLIEKCASDEPSERLTFEQIVYGIENNHEYITELIDESEFLKYSDYLHEYNVSFDPDKIILTHDDFSKLEKKSNLNSNLTNYNNLNESKTESNNINESKTKSENSDERKTELDNIDEAKTESNSNIEKSKPKSHNFNESKIVSYNINEIKTKSENSNENKMVSCIFIDDLENSTEFNFQIKTKKPRIIDLVQEIYNKKQFKFETVIISSDHFKFFNFYNHLSDEFFNKQSKLTIQSILTKEDEILILNLIDNKFNLIPINYKLKTSYQIIDTFINKQKPKITSNLNLYLNFHKLKSNDVPSIINTNYDFLILNTNCETKELTISNGSSLIVRLSIKKENFRSLPSTISKIFSIKKDKIKLSIKMGNKIYKLPSTFNAGSLPCDAQIDINYDYQKVTNIRFYYQTIKTLEIDNDDKPIESFIPMIQKIFNITNLTKNTLVLKFYDFTIPLNKSFSELKIPNNSKITVCCKSDSPFLIKISTFEYLDNFYELTVDKGDRIIDIKNHFLSQFNLKVNFGFKQNTNNILNDNKILNANMNLILLCKKVKIICNFTKKVIKTIPALKNNNSKITPKQLNNNMKDIQNSPNSNYKDKFSTHKTSSNLNSNSKTNSNSNKPTKNHYVTDKISCDSIKNGLNDIKNNIRIMKDLLYPSKSNTINLSNEKQSRSQKVNKNNLNSKYDSKKKLKNNKKNNIRSKSANIEKNSDKNHSEARNSSKKMESKEKHSLQSSDNSSSAIYDPNIFPIHSKDDFESPKSHHHHRYSRNSNKNQSISHYSTFSFTSSLNHDDNYKSSSTLLSSSDNDDFKFPKSHHHHRYSHNNSKNQSISHYSTSSSISLSTSSNYELDSSSSFESDDSYIFASSSSTSFSSDISSISDSDEFKHSNYKKHHYKRHHSIAYSTSLSTYPNHIHRRKRSKKYQITSSSSYDSDFSLQELTESSSETCISSSVSSHHHNHKIKQHCDIHDISENEKESIYLDHCSEEIEVNEFLTILETVEYLKNRLNIDNIFIFTKNEVNGFYYPVDANKRLYEFKTQLYAHSYISRIEFTNYRMNHKTHISEFNTIGWLKTIISFKKKSVRPEQIIIKREGSEEQINDDQTLEIYKF